MHFIALASCFLLLCFGHHHARHHHRHFHSPAPISTPVAPPVATPVDPVLRPTKNCDEIGTAYDDFFYSATNGFGSGGMNRDKFVARYPVKEQHRVLVCLEQTGRGN